MNTINITGLTWNINGLSASENRMIQDCLEVWALHSQRNAERSAYYEAKEPLKDFNMVMPKKLKQHYTPLGWARKAVDMLAELNIFEGFVFPGMDDPYGLDQMMARLGFSGVLQQAIQNAYVHGCSFLTAGRGSNGRAFIQTSTAEASAAIWDYEQRHIKAGLTISDIDKRGNAVTLVSYLPSRTVVLRKNMWRWEITGEEPTPQGRAAMVRLAFKPTQTKPFGRSKISRDAMKIIDGANRIILRAEGNEEFYAWPKIILTGLAEDLVANSNADEALNQYMGRWTMFSKDSEGSDPKVQQVQASPMDPHLNMLKTWASMFASITNIPASSLGVVSDANPTSAEATMAQREDLIVEAKHANRDFADSIIEAARMAVLLENPSVNPDELLSLQVNWANPSMPSTAMSADAFVKLAGTIENLSSSDVGLERAGFSRSEIIRLRADQKKQAGQETLNQLIGLEEGDSDDNTGRPEQADQSPTSGSETRSEGNEIPVEQRSETQS